MSQNLFQKPNCQNCGYPFPESGSICESCGTPIFELKVDETLVPEIEIFMKNIIDRYRVWGCENDIASLLDLS